MTCLISPIRRLKWTCILQRLHSRRCRAASASARSCLAAPATSLEAVVPVPAHYPTTNSFKFHTYEKQGEGGGVQAQGSLFRSLLHSLPSATTHLLISQSLPHSLRKTPGCGGYPSRMLLRDTPMIAKTQRVSPHPARFIPTFNLQPSTVALPFPHFPPCYSRLAPTEEPLP